MKREILKVVNIKCGGCEKSIKLALESEGINGVEVSHENQTVSFEGDKNLAIKILTKLGYPEANSKKAKSILKKARSYTTCAVGSVVEGVENKKNRGNKFWLLILLPLVIFFILGVAIASLWSSVNISEVPKIDKNILRANFYNQEVATLESAHGFRKDLADGSANKKFVLVDLRSPEEYEAGHIITAINIPAYTSKDNLQHTSEDRVIGEFQRIKKENPEKEIVVYCYSSACMTGRKVGNLLAKNNIFVKELTVGWNEWKYFPNSWNHPHEWEKTNIEDYIFSGTEPGEVSKSLLPEGCKLEGGLGC